MISAICHGFMATEVTTPRRTSRHSLLGAFASSQFRVDEHVEFAAVEDAFDVAGFDAGADVAITSSYHASYEGFRAAGFTDEETTGYLALSVELARRAQPADRPTFVAGSVGLYGVVWANGTEYSGDYANATDDAIATEQRRRIQAMVDAGADLLAIETISNGREAVILGELLAEFPATESWVTFCCKDDHHLSDGTPIGEAIRSVTRSGRRSALAPSSN